MFGRHHNEDLDSTAHAWSWPGAERARRRNRRRVEAERINELRWQWRTACTGTSLAPMIYTPSGPTRAVPVIGRIELGPPVSFTVRIRPGQTIAEYIAAAPSIAPALGAESFQVVPLIQQNWVRIVLVTDPYAEARGLITSGPAVRA